MLSDPVGDMEDCGVAELLEEFSRAQYRTKDVSPKVEVIEKRCLALFGKDYCYSLIQNTNGDLCSHYPRQIVFLEYESTEEEKNTKRTNQEYGIPNMLYTSIMIDEATFGPPIYENMLLDDYVDAPLSIPVSLTRNLNIDWREYQHWDLVKQTQNYLKLLIQIINGDDNSGLLVHCISGWDRTPLFVSLLRLSLWADGIVHSSLDPVEILYLTIAYDWFLFGHMLADRLSKGEEIFFFCFNFLKHITSDEFSSSGRKSRRKSVQPRDSALCLEDFCMLKRRDRGSANSLSSDFSVITEDSPCVSGSFNCEAVDLMSFGTQGQAVWKKTHTSSPQTVPWYKAPSSAEDRLLQPAVTEAKSSSSSSSNHSDIFLRSGSSPLEVPQRRSAEHSLPGSSVSTDYGSWQMVSEGGSVNDHSILSSSTFLPFSFPDEHPNTCLMPAQTERESRLEAVRSIFLAAYSAIGLKSVSPSPSGAISGLLEQFARGVGLRGTSNIV
ncbi:myotubularin-related protein 14 [Bombina bombina]|uniref:myotubularin-related protein 14 n=1 Tax=Bombina bombina TaxID=8345 RepID=UPI00235A9454|nr:myotubularin-related protein 14 [Bombina bombina]